MLLRGVMQVTELLQSMTPANMRLDLQTSLYDACKGTMLDAMPKAKSSTEPWFDFEYTEAELPAATLRR